MSILIKGQIAALGLVIVLAGPAYSQTDSSARHLNFTEFMSNNNNDGKHRTFTVRATDADGNTYRMRKVGDQVVEFRINNQLVSKDQYGRYEELFDELSAPPPPPVPPVAPVPPVEPMGPVAPAAPADPVAPVAPVAPAPPAVPGAGAIPPLPPVSPLPPTPPVPPEPPRANKYISKIIDELLDKGIIENEKKLIFSLDSAQFTVNGVKQPDDIFQAFKQKFIKHPGDHVNYEQSGFSSISNIKIEDDNH
jgi:hypothetical protein